jgi:hypothetical protein
VNDALARIREAALKLPETEERLSHGQPTFFVAGKQFAQYRPNAYGDPMVVCVRTTGSEEQAMLIEAAPETYLRPAYLGPSGWVGIKVEGERVDWDHVADRIARSWELAAPRRLLEMGGR